MVLRLFKAAVSLLRLGVDGKVAEEKTKFIRTNQQKTTTQRQVLNAKVEIGSRDFAASYSVSYQYGAEYATVHHTPILTQNDTLKPENLWKLI